MPLQKHLSLRLARQTVLVLTLRLSTPPRSKVINVAINNVHAWLILYTDNNFTRARWVTSKLLHWKMELPILSYTFKGPIIIIITGLYVAMAVIRTLEYADGTNTQKSPKIGLSHTVILHLPHHTCTGMVFFPHI